MYKIGILFGHENNFPFDLIDIINNSGEDVNAGIIKVGAIKMDDLLEYDVILDRVSHEVPFYRSLLKLAVLNNVSVVNNPFLLCANDSFVQSVFASKLSVRVPKTVMIPTKDHPLGTNSDTMRNLIYPLNWEDAFEYIGFPCYLKHGNGTIQHNIYKVYSQAEFFAAYDLTGPNLMLMQENIEFEAYYRCYVVGRKHTMLMNYDPSKPPHLRFRNPNGELKPRLRREMEKTAIKICNALGFDFNSVEFAIRNNKPYAVDFLNPSPIADSSLLTEEEYQWLLATTAEFLISYAKDKKNYSSRWDLTKFTSESGKGKDAKPAAKTSIKKRGRPAKAKVKPSKKKLATGSNSITKKDSAKQSLGINIDDKATTSNDMPKKRGRPVGAKSKAKVDKIIKIENKEESSISPAIEDKPKKKGRPVGAKSKVKKKSSVQSQTKKRRGRPTKPKKRGRPIGSKSKPKIAQPIIVEVSLTDN